MRKNLFDEPIREFQKVLELDPNYTLAYNWLVINQSNK
jgi:hypothetical protein